LRENDHVTSLLLASVGAIALAGTAFAADLPLRAPPPVYVPPAFTWSGIYIGLTAGYAQGFHNSYTDEDPSLIANTSASYNRQSQGFIGGGTLGINWQVGSLVYGLETDFSGLTNSKTEHRVFDFGTAGGFPTEITTDQNNARINFLGTVRGRLGLAVDRTLLYFTAGFAYAGVHNSNSFTTVFGPPTFVSDVESSSFSSGTTRVGWVVGTGLEYALTPNWTLKGEALYANLGATSSLERSFDSFTGAPLTFFPSTAHFDTGVAIIRAGVNYKFDWLTPAPVVAKY
jgi:outer membrane immunogenic protein